MSAAIYLVAFFAGASAVAALGYFAREFLVVFLGSEMSLAVLLFGWLTGFAAGARAAGTRIAAAFRPAYLLSVFLAAWLVCFPVAILAVRISRAIAGVEVAAPAPLWKLICVGLVFVGPLAALMGAVVVALRRLGEAAFPVGRAAVAVGVAAGLGGMAGGAIFTFFLAGRVGPFEYGFAVYVPGAVCIIAVVRAAASHRALAARTATAASLGVAMLATLAGAMWLSGNGARLDRNSALARMRTIARGVSIDSAESRFQNVTLALDAGRYTIYGNGQALHTFPEPLSNELTAGFVLTQAADRERVLVVGGGLELAKAVLEAGAGHVDYVAVDPAVINAAAEHLDGEVAAAPASPGLEVVRHIDARRFVARAGGYDGPYSCILLAVGMPRSLFLDRFYTQELMSDAAGALKSGGILAIKLPEEASDDAEDIARRRASVYRTTKSVFPNIVATPGTPALLIASRANDVVTTSAEELIRRYLARRARSSIFPDAFERLLPSEATAEINDELAGRKGPVNSQSRPATGALIQSMPEMRSGSPAGALVAKVLAVPERSLFLAFLAVGVVVAVPVAVRRRGGAAMALGVAYTGFSAALVMIVIIYVFQLTHGSLYIWMGALLGGFAAGGGGGAFLGVKFARKRGAPVVAQMVVAAACLHMLLLLWLSAGEIIGASPGMFLWMACVAGLAAAFELMIATELSRNGGVAGMRGRLEGLSVLGASLGAIAAGVVIVPVVGPFYALGLAAGLKVVSVMCALLAPAADRPPLEISL